MSSPHSTRALNRNKSDSRSKKCPLPRQMFLFFLLGFFLNEIAFHFRPCCVSLCLLRSTFLWKPLPQRSQANGLYPVCFLLCVMRLELWLNAFPHTWHLCGFSPKFKKKEEVLFFF